MSKSLLPLCNVPRITNRDGGTGPLARLNLPFFGFFFADGKQILENNTIAQAPQDNALTLTGVAMPNLYAKDCCDDIGDGTNL